MRFPEKRTEIRRMSIEGDEIIICRLAKKKEKIIEQYSSSAKAEEDVSELCYVFADNFGFYSNF